MNYCITLEKRYKKRVPDFSENSFLNNLFFIMRSYPYQSSKSFCFSIHSKISFSALISNSTVLISTILPSFSLGIQHKQYHFHLHPHTTFHIVGTV